MLRGLTTVSYQAADLGAAKQWYTEFLGLKPYFDTPAYVEFRIGDYQHELGIIDAAYLGELGAGHDMTTPGGALAYWHVDDVPATVQWLLSHGATLDQAPRDFGDGFVGASVIDPF